MPLPAICDLRLHFPGHGQATNYRRQLDLNDAVARDSSIRLAPRNFRREAFISYPDQVLVVRITASEAGGLTFTATLDSPQPEISTLSPAGNMLRLSGQIQPRQNPSRSWTGSWTQPGMRFAAVLRVETKEGPSAAKADGLEISDADSVTILFSNATSFRNYRDIGGDALGTAQEYLSRAEQTILRSAAAKTYGRFSPVVFSRCVTSWR